MTLHARYLATKSNRPDALNLRLHRALSWLGYAQDCEDLDVRFITLWVGFNAVYAKEVLAPTGDRVSFRGFITQICSFDTDGELHAALYERFSGSIRLLLQSPYAFAPFWEYQNAKIAHWEDEFIKANKKAFQAIVDKEVDSVLFVVFDRLYTLRNQLVHGGATHGSSLNREQLSNGCLVLQALLPIIIKIVMDNPNQDWGQPFYPVV